MLPTSIHQSYACSHRTIAADSFREPSHGRGARASCSPRHLVKQGVQLSASRGSYRSSAAWRTTGTSRWIFETRVDHLHVVKSVNATGARTRRMITAYCIARINVSSGAGGIEVRASDEQTAAANQPISTLSLRVPGWQPPSDPAATGSPRGLSPERDPHHPDQRGRDRAAAGSSRHDPGEGPAGPPEARAQILVRSSRRPSPDRGRTTPNIRAGSRWTLQTDLQTNYGRPTRMRWD